MRKTLFLDYLYISILSIILFSSPSCLSQAANSPSGYSDGQVRDNGELNSVDVKQNERGISDEKNQRIQRRQLIDKQIRRGRELGNAANSRQLRGISKAPTSGDQRFKKSDHKTDLNSGKLSNKKNNLIINSGAKDLQSRLEGDQANQPGISLRSSSSVEGDEVDSHRNEAKRDSISIEADRMTKPKSRAMKEIAIATRAVLDKDKLKVHDAGRYDDFDDDKRQESGNEQLDFDEKSDEYEETDDDDEDPELSAEDAGYKENDSEVPQAGEESGKLNPLQSSVEDDRFEREDIVKRETGVADEYEDVGDQEETCEDFGLVEESDSGFVDRKERDESRVKRDDIGASETVPEKNGAPDQNEAAKQQGKAFEHLENAVPASSLSRIRTTRGKNLKRDVNSENLGKDKADSESKESNEQAKEEGQTDTGLKGDTGQQSDVKLDDKKMRNLGNVADTKDAPAIATETRDSKQESKSDELRPDEKKLENQIQQRIDSIKEEIKREAEEKQKIREIELNNAKYDEIQSEIDEEEDEDNQNLDIPNERKSVLKRSIVDGIRNSQMKTKRHILRRVKRSDTTDARQLQAVEGVEKLDPDVFAKAKLRHESIRKRSAPIYGAVDKDAPDTWKPLLKKNAYPRRIHLVNNEKKRSAISREREKRNTVIIPERAHVNIEDELPASLHGNLIEDSCSPGTDRCRRSADRFERRKRASAVVPEGRVAFLGYRPQDDDENDEGSEFDDDGFEDRTSNLQQDKSYGVSHDSMHNQYLRDETRDENPANFLFAGVDPGPDEYLVRRRRNGMRDDEAPSRLHGGGATLARRQTRARAKQMQAAQITKRNNIMDRDKRQAKNGLEVGKSNSMASLVASSQELSPRLATEYKEAFGGLQSDPGVELARFKRVKRDFHRPVP